MSEMDRFGHTLQLLTKLCVITGWLAPEGDLQNILIDQLCKKLSESYANVNADEVEYAFRNNTTVKDWGKTMNLAMIDEVLIRYMNQRYQLSQLEEQAKKPAEIEYKPIPMTDEELLSATYEVWKLVKKADVIPESVYFYLVGEGKINLTTDQKKEIAARVHRQGLTPELYKTTCRKVTVEDYFKSLNIPLSYRNAEGEQWNEIK
jgi:hypothetical protein